MTLLGLVGVLMGMLFGLFAMIERTRLRVGMFALLYMAHLASTAVYFSYVQSAGGDAELYYYDYLGWYEAELNFGTSFLIYVVQFLRDAVGGTYFDYFLLFQAIGFGGVATMMRIFEEAYRDLGIEQPPWTYLLLFLPSVQFWTAAIGKDAPLFLASALSLWAAMNIRRRWIVLVGSIALMVTIRPHIAVIAVVAVAITLLFERRFTRITRMLLLAIAGAAAVFAISTTESATRLDLLDANSVTEFVAARDNIANSAAAGNMSVQGSFGERFVSLMVRPLFFDAEDWFGYVASSENVFLLFLYIVVLANLRSLLSLFRNSAFIRYAVTFSFAVAIVLTLAYYNVGLGLRQRTMLLPGLISIFLTLVAVRSARRRELTAAWT